MDNPPTFQTESLPTTTNPRFLCIRSGRTLLVRYSQEFPQLNKQARQESQLIVCSLQYSKYLTVSFVSNWLLIQNSFAGSFRHRLFSFPLELEFSRSDLSMLAKSEIRQLDVSLCIQQDIIWLEVSMDII